MAALIVNVPDGAGVGVADGGVGVEEGVGDGVAVEAGTTPIVKLTDGLATPICVTELSHRVA